MQTENSMSDSEETLAPAPLTRSTSVMETEPQLSEEDKYDQYLDKPMERGSRQFDCGFSPTNGKPIPFDLGLLVINPPVRQAFGQKITFGYKEFSTADPGAFQIRTPVMRVPYGVSEFKNDRGVSIVIELDFGDANWSPEIYDFWCQMRELDTYVFQTAIKNRDKWMPGASRRMYPDSNLWVSYRGITRARRNTTGQVYPPRLPCKFWTGKSVMFDKQRLGFKSTGTEPCIDVNSTTMGNNTWCKLILECTGVWTNGEKFGPSFRVVQGRLCDQPTGYEEPTKKPITSAQSFDF